nr:ABC transporter permease [Bacteroidota bacterium]
MIKNYLTIAIRNILRKRTSSLINILGLAIGTAVAILIYLWIQYETSYAKCFDKHNILYLAYCEYIYPTGNNYSGVTSTALGPALMEQFPEIVKYARTSSRKWVIGTEKRRFSEIGTPVDSSFFSMYSLKFVRGNPQEAFSDLHNIILSESLAKKIFGESDPINQTIRIEDWYDAKVTGVYEDFPKETHFWTNYEFFVPFGIFEEIYGWNTNEWGSQNYQTYIQLASEDVDIQSLKEKVAGIKKKNQPETNAIIKLKPITQMHLQNLEGGGLITYIYILSVVAIFIILIACINYLNLSTALAVSRSKEIGMRKVVGADRKKLITQFLTESILLALIAVNFAIVIVKLSLPYINQVLDKGLSLNYTPMTIISLLGFVVLIGLLAGIYPAIIQASFNTISCLKGTFKSKAGQLVFRKVLVVFQFFLSVLVILGTLTISRQISFIMNKDLGYHKENIVCLNLNNAMRQNYYTIVAELQNSPYILNVCPSNTTLDSWESSVGGNEVSWEGQTPGHILSILGILGVGFNFDTMYNLTMVDGRFFSKDFTTDIKGGCVVNETAVKNMGMVDPIGKTMKAGDMERKIIGVVKDFHFSSLHKRIEPLFIALGWGIDNFCIRVQPDNEKEALAFIESKFKEIIPNEPFNYTFLDENVKSLYAEEETIQEIMNFSSFLAIFISCLGLFGLSFFVTERRFKEIGIRKVNGATVFQITRMFIADFIKLILIAIVLAFPVGYYISASWLNNFDYKIQLSWHLFFIAGLIVIVVAIATVGFQVLRAAGKNPVDSLKYE